MKNLIKKAIGKAKTAAKVTKEAVRELTEEDPGFCLAMAALLGAQATFLVAQILVAYGTNKQYSNYVDGWNDGAEETRKNLITALVNNRIGHGESEADAFKMANGLVETVERR